MLDELRKYNNLGTLGFFMDLLELLTKDDILWTKRDINRYFYNRIIDGRSIFDGGLYLAETTGIIKVDEDGYIRRSSSFDDNLKDEVELGRRIITTIFEALKEDVDMQRLFDQRHFSYDLRSHQLIVSKKAFGFRFANFKQLLLDLKVLIPYADEQIGGLLIDPLYKTLFDRIVLPKIRERRILMEEFLDSMEQKRIFGEEAERYVLEVERARLGGRAGIDWVAEYCVSEGYDIASFESELSIEHDRFIEVKSYAGHPRFYWSRNEMDKAKQKRSSYYLYLVDRERYKEKGYLPNIIKDPYVTVLNDSPHWTQTVETISFEYNGRSLR